jgi:hypothetical protein
MKKVTIEQFDEWYLAWIRDRSQGFVRTKNGGVSIRGLGRVAIPEDLIDENGDWVYRTNPVEVAKIALHNGIDPEEVERWLASEQAAIAKAAAEREAKYNPPSPTRTKEELASLWLKSELDIDFKVEFDGNYAVVSGNGFSVREYVPQEVNHHFPYRVGKAIEAQLGYRRSVLIDRSVSRDPNCSWANDRM